MSEHNSRNTTSINFSYPDENENPSINGSLQSEALSDTPEQPERSQNEMLPNDLPRPSAPDRVETQRLDAPERKQVSAEPQTSQGNTIVGPNELTRSGAASRDQTLHDQSLGDRLPDDLVTVHEAVELFRIAGLERSIRTVQKYCSPQRKGRALKCHVTPTENGVRYMIERSSIEHFVHEAGAQAPVGKREADESAAAVPESTPVKVEVDDLAVYDHPYVKRLEREIEKKETRFDDLQIRYENAMDMAQNRLVELQQASAVAQSENLGKFMLEAKRIDQGDNQVEPDNSQIGDSGNISNTPPFTQPNPMSTSPQSEHRQD